MVTKARTGKAPAKQSAKKSAVKKSMRKYSPAAGAQVAEDLHEMLECKLNIGKSAQILTDPKQAIAIGLAQARRAGKKVPRDRPQRRRAWEVQPVLQVQVRSRKTPSPSSHPCSRSMGTRLFPRPAFSHRHSPPAFCSHIHPRTTRRP